MLYTITQCTAFLYSQASQKCSILIIYISHRKTWIYHFITIAVHWEVDKTNLESNSMRVPDSQPYLCAHQNYICSKKDVIFLSSACTESSAAGFVVVIHHLPVANSFIILNGDSGKIILGKSKCFFIVPHCASVQIFIIWSSTSLLFLLQLIQTGRSAFCRACLSGIHYSAQPFFILCSQT